jgi:hypothetical protein
VQLPPSPRRKKRVAAVICTHTPSSGNVRESQRLLSGMPLRGDKI